MKKTTTLILSLAITAAAGDYGRFDRLCNRSETGRTTRGQQCEGVPTFEFATASGVGMPATCDCITYPTGTKGEQISFTRGSAAVCTKGSVSSSIADGDLVQCGFNQTRIMPGGDGSGGNGVLLEPAATNLLLQSEDFTTSWVLFNDGVALPTVTSNYATAPNGTLTADRVQVSACPGADNRSMVYESITTASATVASIYAKGTSGNAAMSLCVSGAPGLCSVCNLNAATWTRCFLPQPSFGGLFYVFGCNNGTSFYNGASNTGAADFLVWGAQLEETTSGTASSYIKTTTVAATRAVDVGYFNETTWPKFTNGSLAATMVLNGLVANRGLISLNDGAGNFRDMLESNPSGTINSYVDGSVPSKVSTTLTTGTHRISMGWDASIHRITVDGASVVGAGKQETGATPILRLNTYNSATGLTHNGTVKNICADATRSGKCL